MTPFSPEASQALLDLELGLVSSLLQSAPLSALMLLGAVSIAVTWLAWSEARRDMAHRQRAWR